MNDSVGYLLDEVERAQELLSESLLAGRCQGPHCAIATCAHCIGSGVVEGFDGDVPCSSCQGRGHLHPTYDELAAAVMALTDERNELAAKVAESGA